MNGVKNSLLLYELMLVAFIAGCHRTDSDYATDSGLKVKDTVIRANVIILSRRFDSVIHVRQLKALDVLSKEDTTAASPFWPGVSVRLFYDNVRRNILFPDKINQGRSTNFCSYAAMTHLLIKYHPDLYIHYILSLYHNGEVSLKKKTLIPSLAVRQAAGILNNKGDLDVLHADQLWFLTLADQFKGYINILNLNYDPGDESTIWAGTNYAKFNRMLADFTDDELTSRGSDILKPFVSNLFDYISSELRKGVVVLYLNSKYLYPTKYSLVTLQAPTHFVVAYNMYKIGDMIEFQYWDYGLRTQQLITSKRLQQLIFGVTTITRITDEAN
ncbi:MAG: hypothetical protein C5B59_20635 [Bacteroidetes bacterium]|nr:MAG: hypothetical protein C5B59_20635 [Bacteroidota bacterium]